MSADESEQGDLGPDSDPDQDGQVQTVSGLYNAQMVQGEVFEELRLDQDMVEEVQATWECFQRSGENREAVGESIYAAIFESAPGIQSLFKTPRAVMAMRFMGGLHQIVGALRDPTVLKNTVEMFGFQHLDLEVTPPRVVMFRNAIVDLLQLELGDRLTPAGRDGWCTLLNYTGGAYIYIRAKFSVRLRVLSSSWAVATTKGDPAEEADPNGEAEESEEKDDDPLSGECTPGEVAARDQRSASPKPSKSQNGASRTSGDKSSGSGGFAQRAVNMVPTTYKEMFSFNAAVMGFANRAWLWEVLASFDTIVANCSNTYRLQEECDVLALRLAKFKGTMNLPDYKAVMLASLRSLVPKDWDSEHEEAWSWLWDNVERMIRSLLGKPAAMERALETMLRSLDEKAQATIRRGVYARFFALAPGGEEHFKQSTTRLHFIADKVCGMTLEMYKAPKRMVEEISGMGLRHVGYGIPTDLFGPFVTACVEVVRSISGNAEAEAAFSWSLSLISRILMRVINEGSTIVMRAINANSAKLLRKAVSCAPRAKRALWVLNVQVGTQSISPLFWAIESGSLEAARAIVLDLLTIRGDRDRYYFGADALFERHPDIIGRLCSDAPALLTPILDGLIWRSRTSPKGWRRVNYFWKYLLVDAEGNFDKALEWITASHDPHLACHPLVSLVTDTVWLRVAFSTFLAGKVWFVLNLCVFVITQAILSQLSHRTDGIMAAVFAGRLFIYVLSLGEWQYYHAKHALKDVRQRNMVMLGPVPIPAYLVRWRDFCSVMLVVLFLLMLILEPMLHCHGKGEDLFTDSCEQGLRVQPAYSAMCMCATLVYFLLLGDLSVLSTHVSAFALVCAQVLSEVALFLVGLLAVAVAFAAAICALEQDHPDFVNIPATLLRLVMMTFGMYNPSKYAALSDYPMLLAVVFAYVIVSVTFLFNVLVAQLCCSYHSVFKDMLGHARLNRGRILVETMSFVSKERWGVFVASLRLDDRIEFGEGDMGLSGGVQLLEPASDNITAVDTIRRFGGSTCPSSQWPEETGAHGGDPEDVVERMERMVERAMKRMARKTKASKSSTATDSSLRTGSSLVNSSEKSGSQAGSELDD